MGDPILNQPWEDVADDVTGAIEKAVQPLLKKAVDDIYSGLLDATQDYLKENLAFNIASRIETAEYEASRNRQRCADLLEALVGLCDSVDDLIGNSEGVTGLHLNGDVAPWSSLIEGGQFEPWLLALSDARSAIAKARGQS